MADEKLSQEEIDMIDRQICTELVEEFKSDPDSIDLGRPSEETDKQWGETTERIFGKNYTFLQLYMAVVHPDLAERFKDLIVEMDDDVK